MGTLFLVATPIGNLEDITHRALRVLREVPLIAAEDTRHTGRLLAHFALTTPTLSYHAHNRRERESRLLDALQTGDLALVSDAGTPAINDPGYDLVRAAIAAGHNVVPIPGPSAPVAALVASGLPTEYWTYLGFLPSKRSERRRFLLRWHTLATTLICFETPHRLVDALGDIRDVLGDRQICVAREITKLHESYVRGTVMEAQQHFTQHPPRGEIVLVIAGYEEPAPVLENWQDRARARLAELAAEGSTGAAAAKQVARELGVQRNEVYALLLASSPGQAE